MVGMVFVVLGGLLGMMWFSVHSARRRARQGEVFAPPGKVRWSADDPQE